MTNYTFTNCPSLIKTGYEFEPEVKERECVKNSSDRETETKETETKETETKEPSIQTEKMVRISDSIFTDIEHYLYYDPMVQNDKLLSKLYQVVLGKYEELDNEGRPITNFVYKYVPLTALQPLINTIEDIARSNYGNYTERTELVDRIRKRTEKIREEILASLVSKCLLSTETSELAVHIEDILDQTPELLKEVVTTKLRVELGEDSKQYQSILNAIEENERDQERINELSLNITGVSKRLELVEQAKGLYIDLKNAVTLVDDSHETDTELIHISKEELSAIECYVFYNLERNYDNVINFINGILAHNVKNKGRIQVQQYHLKALLDTVSKIGELTVKLDMEEGPDISTIPPINETSCIRATALTCSIRKARFLLVEEAKTRFNAMKFSAVYDNGHKVDFSSESYKKFGELVGRD
jgi:hypothetical protein